MVGSFQFAYQDMTWKDDIVNGQPRQPGLDNFLQVRVVAPLVYDKFTILPRLTLRHYEKVKTGESGIGNPEQQRILQSALTLPRPYRQGKLKQGPWFGNKLWA